MKKDSRYIWYILDTVVFLAINALVITNIHDPQLAVLENVNWPIILIFALGVYRLTDIITYENVTAWIRAPFEDRKIVEGKEVWETSTVGFRGFFGTLVSCNACMGVWVSMIVFYLFLFFPSQTFVFMVIMTLTSFERFLSKIYNFLEKRGS